MKRFGLMLLTLFFLMPLSNAYAVVDLTVFDGDFVRGTGSPVEDVRVFAAIEGPAKIILSNGGVEDDEYEKVSSSIILINGQEAFTSSDFNQNIYSLEDEINLHEGENNISVLLRSKPDGMVRVEVIQEIAADGAGIIGPEGGIIEVIDPGSPIFGTKIIISEDALENGEVIGISYEDEPPLPPDGNVTVASKFFSLIKSGDSLFQHPVQVTIPFFNREISDENIPSVFYWDSSANRYSAVEINEINKQDSTITFSTIHFSGFVTLVAKLVTSTLLPPADTGFKPEYDGFEIVNFGVSGKCIAFPTYSKWYWDYKKLTDPVPLNIKYRESVAKQLIARTYYLYERKGWADLVLLAKPLIDDATTGMLLISNMFINKSPQILMIKGLTQDDSILDLKLKGHAVLVYKYENGKFYIYDSNFPEKEVTVEWDPVNGFHNYRAPHPTYDYPFDPYKYWSLKSYYATSLSSVVKPEYLEFIYKGAETEWSNSIYPHVEITTPETDANDESVIGGQEPVIVTGNVSGGKDPADNLTYFLNDKQEASIPIVGDHFSFNLSNLSSYRTAVAIVPKRADNMSLAGFKEIFLIGGNVPPLAPVLNTPLNSAVNLDPDSVLLSWNESHDPENDAVFYCVTVKEDSSPNDIPVYLGCDQDHFTANSNSATIFDNAVLEPGKTYWWAVWAKDSNNNWSEASEWWSFSAVPDPNDIDDDGDSYTENQGDCNDIPAIGIAIYPGASELCDGVINNCDNLAVADGSGEGWFNQATSCGQGACEATGVLTCTNGVQVNTCIPGLPIAEICGDGIDNNCNGQVDENCIVDFDNDGDGFEGVLGDNQDCDDFDPASYPGAIEICGDGIDQDCDGFDDDCVVDLNAGLVAYYPFNGNANDESGNGNDGSINGNAQFVTGVKGDAIEFDGIDDFIEIPDSSSLNPSEITISAWIMPYGYDDPPDSTSAHHIVINKENQYEIAVLVDPYLGVTGNEYVESGELTFAFNADMTPVWLWQKTNYYPQLNNYIHVAVSFDNNNMATAYVNGQEVSSFQYNQGLSPTDNVLRIGARLLQLGATNYAYFNGIIDEVKIYNRALSEDEIDALYNIEAPVDLNAGLVAYYPFNGNANDESENNNDGTVYGATLSTDRFGNVDSAYSFDGVDDYIEKTNPTDVLNIGSQDWSIFAWVRVQGSNPLQTIVSRYECGWDCPPDVSEALYRFRVKDCFLVAELRGDGGLGDNSFGGYTAWGDTNICDQEWHHVGFVLDRNTSTVSIFSDGQIVNSVPAPLLNDIHDGGSPFEIGRIFIQSWNEPIGYFDGLLDDIRIYNRVFSEAEIKVLYNEGGWDKDYDGIAADQDCNDFDNTIFPGAEEICGDGIDQDCDGSDLLCGVSVCPSLQPTFSGEINITNGIANGGSEKIIIIDLPNSNDQGFELHTHPNDQCIENDIIGRGDTDPASRLIVEIIYNETNNYYTGFYRFCTDSGFNVNKIDGDQCIDGNYWSSTRWM